jgi:hypothetical protein
MDLKNYDSEIFKNKTNSSRKTLLELSFNNKEGYRLKEIIFDLRFVAKFLIKNIKRLYLIFPITFLFFCIYPIYLVIYLIFFYFNFIIFFSYVTLLYIRKGSKKINHNQNYKRNKNFKELFEFLFIKTTKVTSFGVLYLIILRPKKDKDEFKKFLEDFLMRRVLGKSKRFFLILMVFTKKLNESLENDI